MLGIGERLVPRGGGLLPLAPWLVGTGLDGHHGDVAARRFLQEIGQIGGVLRVRQRSRVDGQHHAVEIEAAHGLQLCGGGAEVVAGDADEASESLVTCLQDRLDRGTAPIELGQVGDAVCLVQVERVAAQPLQ